MNYAPLLEPIHQFLRCRTPQAWIDEARKPENLTLLLTDHLVCELKAAQTAVWLIRKYVADKPSGDQILAWLKPYENFIFREDGDSDFINAHKTLTKAIIVRNELPWADDLVEKMVLLIKEELHHFYQVWEIMQSRGLVYQKITSSRYAKGLLREVTTHEPDTLVDKLICGAYIEARSCERFASLAPYLDSELEKFYISLLRSEARHYQDYLTLAAQISPKDITARVRAIGEAEAKLIAEPDTALRFHSGVPAF
ncbi:tRNA isopentenyl-2-thiomethyl-A-37 hydroxylase MiaE [Pantoea allii]|uniref:tRNA isopentenyl-2-thiomethyl-A-37 hydroxylase MiaE n=1 Tax=Pantoea allii TaxID=574096 RepID=A0ABS6VBF6_9GAMM|nr:MULTISPECIES: tRNA isopentenyl-2-thiomethyl-A-37 hydroxylase MiaE [Pantoea]MBW1213040.1 tRNA isopentenyl-2-thiomethyl-A-37 hydroxylase MiaE [Pantoea allii]MBW1256642.1 tRNA isopentenyl-2-thiomethyl-A-37 hydroxylase MiaE [Pantoea allii]MBW1265712.1 tRNA isopentenyl-2-thiomethyl-A-37 hydroxylase MiaE [Pantoea allii]MBW1287836.1 tRNA isopentenyl-2-thiomethyl-A-37 hydroxylase MiaE [Pantoea allii]OAE07100.1 tRNA hydroxylase [Pantoea sp. OXWO6B1]